MQRSEASFPSGRWQHLSGFTLVCFRGLVLTLSLVCFRGLILTLSLGWSGGIKVELTTLTIVCSVFPF